MKINLDIPEGQEAAIYEQAIYGVAGADMIKKQQPDAEVSAMYPVFQQLINQLGSAVPDEQRNTIMLGLQKHIATEMGQPLPPPGDNGTEITQPEATTEADPPAEPKQESDGKET